MKAFFTKAASWSGLCRASVPAWGGCLLRGHHHIASGWELGFSRYEDGACFLTRQIYKASILEKRSVGEADTQRPCQDCFFPKQRETKEITSIPPRHKEHVFTLQKFASELSSLSQELVTNSIQFLKMPIVSSIHIARFSLCIQSQLIFLSATYNSRL